MKFPILVVFLMSRAVIGQVNASDSINLGIDVTLKEDSLQLEVGIQNLSDRDITAKSTDFVFGHKNFSVMTASRITLPTVWALSIASVVEDDVFAAGDFKRFEIDLDKYVPDLRGLIDDQCLLLLWVYAINDVSVDRRITRQGVFQLNPVVCASITTANGKQDSENKPLGFEIDESEMEKIF